MSKLIIIRGCPASGKTTLAEKIRKEKPLTTFIINRDSLRRELHPSPKYPFYKLSRDNEEEVTKAQHDFIKIMLAADNADNTIICDDTNLSEKTVNKLTQVAKQCKAEVEIIDLFDVPLHKLLERDYKRQHPVGPSVIKRFFKKQMEIQGRAIKPVEGLPSCIIVDLDGTICDMRKDNPDGRGPFDWHLVKNDLPRQDVIEVVQMFSLNYQIIFLTGRDGVCYNDSLDWLNKYVILGEYGESEPILFSRREGDCRCDTTIKEEILREHVLPRYNVKLAIDDRDRMILHWRALGLNVWQVNEGDF